jgi:hypothetical protein
MAVVVETFDPVTITNASIQIIGSDGVKAEGTKFGALGSLGGETTLRELIKREEGIEVAKRTKPEKMDLNVSAHVKLQVVRDIFGIKSEDLKPGVYSYGTDSKGKRFTFTADIVDEFEDETKLIAFPNCTTATGFTFTIENGTDEVAEMEVTLSAYPDDFKQIYYEAIVSSLDDPTIAEQWHTKFDRTLVEAVPAL